MLARAAMASNFPLAMLSRILRILDSLTKLNYICQEPEEISSIVSSSPAENCWTSHHVHIEAANFLEAPESAAHSAPKPDGGKA